MIGLEHSIIFGRRRHQAVKGRICAVEMTCPDRVTLASIFGIEIAADGGDLTKLKLGTPETS